MSKFKLQRYSITDGSLLYADSDGDWVSWEDVKPLLKAYLSMLDEEDRREKLKITEVEQYYNEHSLQPLDDWPEPGC